MDIFCQIYLKIHVNCQQTLFHLTKPHAFLTFLTFYWPAWANIRWKHWIILFNDSLSVHKFSFNSHKIPLIFFCCKKCDIHKMLQALRFSILNSRIIWMCRLGIHRASTTNYISVLNIKTKSTCRTKATTEFCVWAMNPNGRERW